MKNFLFALIAFTYSIAALAGSDIKRPDSENYQKGLQELNNENLDKALEYFNKDLESNPKNGYALYYIASIHKGQSEYKQALEDINRSLKLLPKKDKDFIVDAYNERGDIYCELKDTTKALADYSAGIKFDPQNTSSYLNRALVYYKQKKYDLSNADYKQLNKVDPGELIGYLGRGRNFNAQKKWKEAIDEYTYAISLNANFSSAYSNRAESYIGQKDWAKATDDIINALATNRDNSKAYELIDNLEEPALGMLKTKLQIRRTKNQNNYLWPYCLGYICEKKKQYSNAISIYKEALNVDRNTTLLSSIAKCYSKKGFVEQALHYNEEALELDSTDAYCLYQKSSILYDMNDIKGAIVVADTMAKHYPYSSSVYATKGALLNKIGEYEGAIQNLKKSLKYTPDNSSVYDDLARVYKALGKDDSARIAYQKVIEIEDTPDKYNYLPYAYLMLGDKDKALATLDSIFANHKDTTDNYYNAACLYSLMNEKTKALDYFEKVLKRGYVEFAHIKLDKDLDNIRNTDEFKALISKYQTQLDQRIAKEAPKANSASTEITIPFTKENGMCKIKCSINGQALYLLYDANAGTSISMVEATFMMKNGNISLKDMGGSKNEDDEGNVREGTVVNLRKVELEGLKLENIRAIVTKDQKAPLIMGNSASSKLGKVEVDNTKHVIKVKKN